MNYRIYDIEDSVVYTCSWLETHRLYLDWLNQKSRLLWINGKPGAGKSTLMKHALELAKTARSKFIAFFFHGRGTELQKTLLGLFRSLLHQVLQEVPRLLTRFGLLYQKKVKTEGEFDRRWTWQLGELKSIFRSYLLEAARFQSIRLYIDALDEAGEDTARNLVTYFHDIIMHGQETKGLSICFSCRHYPLLTPPDSLSICVEEENRDGIATYVRYQLHHRLGDRPEAQELLEEILTRAVGVFQWVVLIAPRLVRLLEQGKSIKTVRSKVRDIPSALNSLYAEILDKIDVEDRPHTVKLMQWICFAIRPLSVTELRYAMIVDQDSVHNSLMDCKDSDVYAVNDADMRRAVKSVSGGLLEVIESLDMSKMNGNEKAPMDGTVQFIHQSVQDYIITNGLATLTRLPASSILGQGHFQLSRSCIQFMTLEDVLWEYANSTRDNLACSNCSLPLLQYSLEYWMVHAINAESHQHPSADLPRRFGWPSNSLLEKVLLMSEKYAANGHPDVRPPPKGSTLLHIASRYRLLGLLTELLQSMTGAEDDAKDKNGRTPLSYAAESGHVSVVRTLLNSNKIDVNAKDHAGSTSLYYAVQANERSVHTVRLLLEHRNIDVNPTGLFDDTPLTRASELGNQDVMRLLLKQDKVDINAKDAFGQNALMLAIKAADQDTIHMLLQHQNIDTNVQDSKGKTPSHLAVEHDHLELVRLLLEHGKTNLNIHDSLGMTPLQSAVHRGNKEMVEMYLQCKNVDANFPNGQGETAIIAALRQRNIDMVRQLLACHRVNINCKTAEGRPLLSFMLSYQERALMRSLLARQDLHLTSKNPLSDTALSWLCASAKLKTEVMTELVSADLEMEVVAELIMKLSDSGCEVDPVDERGETPLFNATTRGRLRIMDLLLEAGANVDARDQHGHSPLAYLAILSGEERISFRGERILSTYPNSSRKLKDMMELLLRRGASVNFTDNEGKTPLMHLTTFGDRSTKILYLKRGAKVNRESTKDEVSLSQAARSRCHDLAGLLLQWGADVDTKDADDLIPLHYAAQHGPRELVEILLQWGANVNAEGSSRWTPLHYAAWRGPQETAEMLLQRDADVDSFGHGERTPLFYAVRRKSTDMADLLLRHGADPNQEDVEGYTPLFDAISKGGSGHVERLLQAGAQTHFKNQKGRTALHHAKLKGSDRIYTILQQWKDVPDPKDVGIVKEAGS